SVALRVELFGDTVEAISQIDPLKGQPLGRVAQAAVYPASHYVTPAEQLERAIESIQVELGERLAYLRGQGKLLEAQRLEQRTLFDLEMLREIGYCHGVENYSRHLAGRRAGETPATLMDYFPRDTLVVIDESHVTVPQLRGMYHGDRSRKEALVEYGFRLPSAFDNRPLTFDEFVATVGQVLYVSATPGDYELQRAGGAVVEQIIRPTGLMDPAIVVRSAAEQVDDLLEEIRARAERGERVLVTTLTKRMAEDLTQYYLQMGLRVRYLHSDIDTLERVEVIRDLRLGKFDALIGINLLREGLDIPEVSLVAILDADKEGYLRSATSLVQTAGRAARNVHGEVIMYADRVTASMRSALSETERRRALQAAYNAEHGITPESIRRSIREVLRSIEERDYYTVEAEAPPEQFESPEAVAEAARKLEAEMREAAKRLDFERAAELRDRLRTLRKLDPAGRPGPPSGPRRRRRGSRARPLPAAAPLRPARRAGPRVPVARRTIRPDGPHREARPAARPPGRLPLQGRQGAGGLRRQGGVAARPRAVVLPGVADAGRQDGRPRRPDRRPRRHRHQQRAGGADPRVEPGQAPPAPLQHRPAGRQALPVPEAHDQRGVPAAAGRPAGPEGRRHLLRPVLPGHRPPGDAPPGPGPVPAPDVLDQDRRERGPAVPSVLHPPLPRPVHRLGDPGGVRPHRRRRPGVPGGPGRGSGAAAHGGDGAGRRGGEVRAGGHPPRPGAGAEHRPGAAEGHLDRPGGPGHPRPGPPGLRGVHPGVLRPP